VTDQPCWIFTPDTLSSMPVRFEKTQDGTLIRVVPHSRPQPLILLAAIGLPSGFVAMCWAMLQSAPNLTPEWRGLLVIAMIFGGAIGVLLTVGYIVMAAQLSHKPAFVEFDTRSSTVRVPRQGFEAVVGGDGQTTVRLLHGSTQPSQNAKRSRTAIHQVQIGWRASDAWIWIPLITRSSSGYSTTGAFEQFAAAMGSAVVRAKVNPKFAPTNHGFGRLRHDVEAR
jgi:hypothetical protein